MKSPPIAAVLLCLATIHCTPSGASHSPSPDAHHHPAHAEPNTKHDGHAHHRHHRFEDADEWAKQFDDPSRDQWQRPDAVVEFMELAPNAIVADLGAGTGYFSVHFAAAVPEGRVFANDIEPDMIRYLGERADKEGLDNLVPVLGAADDPKLPEAVDVVFMCDVYHHIADRSQYFRVVAERLRPGGRVVIVDFKKDAPPDIPGPPVAMRIAQATVVEELAAAGLTLTRSDRDQLPHQYIVEFTRGDTR